MVRMVDLLALSRKVASLISVFLRIIANLIESFQNCLINYIFNENFISFITRICRF